MRDVEVNGYRLKEGTAIVPQISTVLGDENVFPNPDQFLPERFLDESGHLQRCDALAPFGMGKRWAF
jgi:cytochrome P450